MPTPVEYQTPETEPPVHVACDFDRVGDIADEFNKIGIKSAEICLVGWNCSGHDGRFPQIFPVEPKLGGEKKLRSVIKKIQNYGYNCVCHDDEAGVYTIADCFDEEYLLKNKDGSVKKSYQCWSGGRPHRVCPQREYELFETKNQPKIRKLGFEGIHYIDVLTMTPLYKSYDKNHPLNRKEVAEWYKKIMELSRKIFGGFSSEASFDFAAESLDYVLYSNFGIGKEPDISLGDEVIPFWHIAYHGIILYNPSTFTLNYPVKGVSNRLKLFELGGRPLLCYYANFASDRNWMGSEDFICDTDEQLAQTVINAKKMADDYEAMKDIRYEFITNHEKLSENVYRTTYSNGISITVDYNSENIEIKGKE